MMAGRGRPPRTGVAARRQRYYRLTEDEERELLAVSAELGKPVATILREAVNEYVADFREREVFSSPQNSAAG